VIRIGAVPASAEAALLGGDALTAMEHLDGVAGEAHVDLLADERVRHRVERSDPSKGTVSRGRSGEGGWAKVR
jgi:hypothetical protein